MIFLQAFEPFTVGLRSLHKSAHQNGLDCLKALLMVFKLNYMVYTNMPQHVKDNQSKLNIKFKLCIHCEKV